MNPIPTCVFPFPMFKGKCHEKGEISNPPTLSVAAHLNHPSSTSRALPPCMQCLEKRHKTVLRRAQPHPVGSGSIHSQQKFWGGRGGLYVVKIVQSATQKCKNDVGFARWIQLKGWTPPQRRLGRWCSPSLLFKPTNFKQGPQFGVAMKFSILEDWPL